MRSSSRRFLVVPPPSQGPTKRGPPVSKSGLESRNFGGPIHHRPPSDHSGSEICHSPPTGLAFDRWDSQTKAPTTGNRSSRVRRMMGGDGNGKGI
ncbi:hypothetical protein V6N12_009330 [Hibiscus sabdariffa]|uniref:Uncharacterized protein n=1 Tax=Hibiscus sabdariffa TaxID=183260 RepID=A0ABR2E8T4_9ROSI